MSSLLKMNKSKALIKSQLLFSTEEVQSWMLSTKLNVKYKAECEVQRGDWTTWEGSLYVVKCTKYFQFLVGICKLHKNLNLFKFLSLLTLKLNIKVDSKVKEVLMWKGHV